MHVCIAKMARAQMKLLLYYLEELRLTKHFWDKGINNTGYRYPEETYFATGSPCCCISGRVSFLHALDS